MVGQAESVLGFMNYYQKHPEKTEYFKAVQDIWEYIQTYMVDKRPGSEWFWDLDENKQPSDKKPICRAVEMSVSQWTYVL